MKKVYLLTIKEPEGKFCYTSIAALVNDHDHEKIKVTPNHLSTVLSKDSKYENSNVIIERFFALNNNEVLDKKKCE